MLMHPRCGMLRTFSFRMYGHATEISNSGDRRSSSARTTVVRKPAMPRYRKTVLRGAKKANSG